MDAKVFIVGSHLPVLICLFYAVSRFRRMDGTLRFFCYFLFLTGIVQLASLALWFARINNLPLLHFLVPAGFTLLTFFYARILKGFVNTVILWIILALFLIFGLINSLWIQPLTVYNSNALTAESILIIIYSLSTFIFLLNNIFREVRAGYVASLNWINSGLFIYYSSSLIIFYLGNVLAVSSPSALVKYAWVFHAFFSVVMYIFFIIGLWKRPRN